MRNKLLAIVATLWVAAVGTITIVLYATRTKGPTIDQFAACLDDHEYGYCATQHYDVPHYFAWSSWLAATGIATLVALVAVVIIAIAVPSGTTDPSSSDG